MNDYYDYYSYSSPPAYNPVFTIISLVAVRVCSGVHVDHLPEGRQARLGGHCPFL